MRAGDGGAASGPYSVPGKVRMSMDSATSNRCSVVQSTICAASGVRSGQFRQSPPLALSKVLFVRSPSAPVPEFSPASRPPAAESGSTVMTPAIISPPSAVSSSARRVGLSGLLRDSAVRHRGTGFCEAWASCRNGSWLSGASNIASHCDRRVTMCDK
ncbi:hypothetical protein MYFR107205_22260 [Mycolicibacterium frederiksbergense]